MPEDPIFGDFGDLASAVVTGAFNEAMKAIWTFATFLLTGALNIVDTYTQPNLDPTTGPLAGLLPTAVWLGSTVVVLIAFVQIGRSVAGGGRGFGRLGIGLAQYVVVSIAGLGVLATMVAASDELARAILEMGLGIENWAGLNAKNSVLENAVNSVSGVGLGLIALLCVIPAAIGFLIEALVRSAGILILAGTIPIVAAGLVGETTRRWFWLAMRWAISLTLMPPVVAFTVVLGMKVAEGAAGAGGSTPGAAHAAVTAVIAGGVLIVALTTPLAMFKLFAFVDPNSLSGASVRGFFAGGRAGGGAGSSGSSEAGAESDTDSRFGQMIAGLDVAGMGGRGQNLAGNSSGILDAIGAGHPGGPGGGAGGGRNSRSGDGSGQASDEQGESTETPPDSGDDVSAAPGSEPPVEGQPAEPAGADAPGPAALPAGDSSSFGSSGGGPSEGGSAGPPAPPAPPGPDSPPPAGGGGGSGGRGPTPTGGGGAAAGGEAAEVAVIAV